MALPVDSLRPPRRKSLPVATLVMISFLLAAACLALLPHPAAAAPSSVEVRIEAPSGSVWDGQVQVDGCTITDSGGGTHVLSGSKAACALAAAAAQGGFTYSFADYGWGLYLTEVAGITSDASNYWLYRVNYVSPPVGLADYDLADGDQMLLYFGPWPDIPLGVDLSAASVEAGQQFTITSTYYDDNQGTIVPLANAQVHLGQSVLTTDAQGQLTTSLATPGDYQVYIEKSGYVRSAVKHLVVLKPVPDQASLDQAAQAALGYLEAQQATDGAIDNAGISAWAAVAFSAAGVDASGVSNQGASLFAFLAGYDPSGGSSTDYARQILAALAAGGDPRAFGTDLVAGLLGFHQDSQVGDTGLINDDIFAVLALLGAGEDVSSPAVSDAVQYILTNQGAGGGFGYAVGGSADVDTTAAAIQALVLARDAGYPDAAGIDAALAAARAWLASSQNADGGFPYSPGGLFGDSNTASTSWVLPALAALGEDASTWRTADGSTPWSYLLEAQNADGSLGWMASGTGQSLMTAYAVPAFLGQPLPVTYQPPACSGNTPSLSLYEEDVRWNSFADYQARLLTVDFSIRNRPQGPGAYNTRVVGTDNTSGVITVTTLPLNLGAIDAGSQTSLTLQYLVPDGVASFRTTIYATAEDGCGNGYQYPQAWPHI